MKTIEIVYYNNETPQFAEKAKYEELPETYEELRSLCIAKSTKEEMIYIFSEWKQPNIEYLQTHTLRFYKDGTIRNGGDAEEGYIIAKDRTPQQMWQIIKALVQE